MYMHNFFFLMSKFHPVSEHVMLLHWDNYENQLPPYLTGDFVDQLFCSFDLLTGPLKMHRPLSWCVTRWEMQRYNLQKFQMQSTHKVAGEMNHQQKHTSSNKQESLND